MFGRHPLILIDHLTDLIDVLLIQKRVDMDHRDLRFFDRKTGYKKVCFSLYIGSNVVFAISSKVHAVAKQLIELRQHQTGNTDPARADDSHIHLPDLFFASFLTHHSRTEMHGQKSCLLLRNRLSGKTFQHFGNVQAFLVNIRIILFNIIQHRILDLHTVIQADQSRT